MKIKSRWKNHLLFAFLRRDVGIPPYGSAVLKASLGGSCQRQLTDEGKIGAVSRHLIRHLPAGII